MPFLSGDAETPRSAKTALRHHLITERKSLPSAVRRRAAVEVQTVLTHFVRAQPRTVISAYAPVGTEPGGADLPAVLAAALPPGGRLLLPLLRDDLSLDWGEYSGTLTAGPRGLLQPDAPPLGVDAIRSAELVIVPALAVDRSGLRLGRGGGSYDRALARAPQALTVALLHDGELVDSVPAEPHDRPVDAVVTPRDGLVLLSGTPDWTK